MLVILQGSLRHFPLRQLLPLLGAHKHSGTLDLEAKGQRARLFLRDGAVIYGESPAGNDVPAIVASLLSEDDATFTFLDGLELPAKAVEAPFAVDALLEEAERRALLARTFSDDARFRVIEAQAANQEINLKPEQFKLLFRIGAGRSFAELMAVGGMTREGLAASLHDLDASGLIARAEDQREEKTSKKRAGALTSGDPQGAVHPLVEDSYTLGRDEGNDIIIADGSVSSKHARITRTADGFAVEDLGSRNGTFVNGEPVKQSVPLSDNDTVRIGKLIFTFNLAADINPGERTQTKTSRS